MGTRREPADATLTAVGGPGKEFWAAGKNWEIAAPTFKPEHRAMMGQWRVEVTPGKPQAEDVFLHVIQVGDQKLAAMDAAELIRDDRGCGVRVQTTTGTWEVTFATQGEPRGRLQRISGQSPLDVMLENVEAQSGILGGR